MYEIYLDESNGSIREEDDIPTEDIETTLNIDNTNGDAKKVIDADESGIKVDADVDKSKLRSSPKKEKEPRDVKEVKDSKENKDGKDSKDSRSSKDSKSGSKDKQSHNLASPGGNNVWVSGLSSSTRAASLQALFKKYGKVLSAKIITNPRMPGSRAHGFITMETTEQAEKCIQHLNKTELDGKTITVSKNRPSESSSSSRHKSSSSSSSTKKDKQKDKDSKSKSGENKELVKDKSNDDNKKSDEKSSHGDDKKKKEKTGDKDKEKEKEKLKDRDKEKERCKSKEKDKEKEKKKDEDQSKEKSEKDKDKDKGSDKDKSKEKDKKDESKDEIKIKKERSSKSLSRSRSRDRKKGSESPRKLFRRPIRRLAPAFLARRMNTRGRSVSSRPNPVLLRRIETERAQRRRERDREIQEAKRRRIELIRTQREVERKAQEERDRLEREMVKLRIERERLEREKAEILRLEREKARLERERLEREREELRRKQFQLPHRIDDSPRGRSGINKRPYDSRGDLRELDLHWDDRKRMSAPSPVTTSGRPFNGAVGSRLSDFDARHGHTSASYDNKGASYRRIKLDNPPSGGASRSEYDLRRESGRHGGSSGGHDRDDRRNAGGPSGGYYRDTSRITGSSRDRDRRGGGRDDWKNSHRRDRYFDKGLTSMGTSYSTGASYSGNNSGDWNSGERGSSNISKLSYQAGPSDSESRSRGAGLGSSIMTGSGNQLSDLYDSSNMPMAGIMSHGGIGSASGLASDERPYIHSVRRF